MIEVRYSIDYSTSLISMPIIRFEQIRPYVAVDYLFIASYYFVKFQIGRPVVEILGFGY